MIMVVWEWLKTVGLGLERAFNRMFSIKSSALRLLHSNKLLQFHSPSHSVWFCADALGEYPTPLQHSEADGKPRWTKKIIIKRCTSSILYFQYESTHTEKKSNINNHQHNWNLIIKSFFTTCMKQQNTQTDTQQKINHSLKKPNVNKHTHTHTHLWLATGMSEGVVRANQRTVPLMSSRC